MHSTYSLQYFVLRIYKMHFPERQNFRFDKNVTEYCSQGPIEDKTSLAQVTDWRQNAPDNYPSSNDDQVHWRIHNYDSPRMAVIEPISTIPLFSRFFIILKSLLKY